jgi:hypothetical protein
VNPADDNISDAQMNAIARDWELPLVNAAAGIDRRWLHSFLSMRIADLLAQVAIGDRLHHLPPKDRAWLKAHAEAVVTDAVEHYHGWQ